METFVWRFIGGARPDIARPDNVAPYRKGGYLETSVFEHLEHTTSLCLLQGVLYELLIELRFLVLFLSTLVIPTCGRLLCSALWYTFKRTM